MVKKARKMFMIEFLLIFLSLGILDSNGFPGTSALETETLSPRTVTTKYGGLRGMLVHLRNHEKRSSSPKPLTSVKSSNVNYVNTSQYKTVEVFLGVPYATPPVGSLRFMPPVTPTHWRGVRLANKLSPVCPQKLPSTKGNSHSSGRSSFASEAKSPISRMASFLKNQSEDCLYLNIYAPFTSNHPSSTFSTNGQHGASGSNGVNKQLVPVVVFILGESYEWGSGNSFDGTILASFGNVVVITLNYRLGVFGFLPAFVDGTPRGNYGLMDQVAALHWVQENIQEFGGDPNNVTLAGHGHGAACVNLLMISPMASSGLFSRVILMSGSALSPWAIAKDAESYAKSLAKLMGCPTSDNFVQTECLRSKPMEQILSIDLKVPDYLTSFGPIIDGIVIVSDPKTSVTDDYLDSGVRGGISSISVKSNSESRPAMNQQIAFDLLFGVTKVEAPAMFTPVEERQGIDVKRRDRILRTLVRNLFDFHQQVIFLTLVNEYTDWSRPSDHPINLIDSLSDILSDALIVSPIVQMGDYNSKLASSSQPKGRFEPSISTSASTPSSRTYFYVFSYQANQEVTFSSSSATSSSFSSSSRAGCQHGDDLEYIFGAPLASDLLSVKSSFGHFLSNYSRSEATLSEAVMTYWTNFVKFGDPNIWPHELDTGGDPSKIRFENVYWPQYDVAQRKYLMIGMKPKVRDHYHSHRLSYWLHLMPRLQQSSDALEDEEEDSMYYYYKHHLLIDHENPATYDGIVRQISLRFDSSSFLSSSAFPGHSSGNGSLISSRIHSNRSNTSRSFNRNQSSSLRRNNVTDTRPSHVQVTGNNTNQHLTDSDSRFPGRSSSSLVPHDSPAPNPGVNGTHGNKTGFPIAMEQSSYSTALTVTIGIGCSLLVLNMLIFAGVYYQLDRAKVSKPNSGRGSLSQEGQDEQKLQPKRSRNVNGKQKARGNVTFQQFEEKEENGETIILKQEPYLLSGDHSHHTLNQEFVMSSANLDHFDPIAFQHHIHHADDQYMHQDSNVTHDLYDMGHVTNGDVRRSPRGRAMVVSCGAAPSSNMNHNSSPSHHQHNHIHAQGQHRLQHFTNYPIDNQVMYGATIQTAQQLEQEHLITCNSMNEMTMSDQTQA